VTPNPSKEFKINFFLKGCENMRKSRQYTVICSSNEGYEVSLAKRKISVALTDDDADKHGLMRIVDESGENYLYPAKLFTQVELPPQRHHALLNAA
jgi:hypothetical protein